MKKILFFDVAEYEVEFLKEACEGKFEYQLIKESLNGLFEISKEQEDAQIISCFTTSRIPNDILEKFKSLELIALRSVGFNHIDIDYCKKNNIYVENTPNYGNMTVAEFALGLLLDVARKVTYSANNLKNSIVDAKCTIGTEIFGKTIGIVGLGAIGSEMARLAHGIGLKILGYDLKENEELKEKYDVQYTDFETLIRNSDFISLHSPLTKENYHLFNKETFELMKPTAFIINTARGELIDTQALYNALIENRIAGAGLDVLESEDTLVDIEYLVDIGRMSPQALQKTVLNNRLMKLDNVIITPHIAYDTNEAINRILNTAISNINAFVEGKIQNNVY